MFRRIDEERPEEFTVLIDGRPCMAREGDSVAAAILASGGKIFRRSMISGASRGPYCMMGVCFECIVRIDGRPGRQACLVPVTAGMCIETGETASEPGR